MFFWIFPAVRQYKTELFWYFLVFAFMDPLNAIVMHFTHIYLYPIFNFLLMLSVLWPFKNKKSIRILTAAILLLLLVSFTEVKFFSIYLHLLIHLIISYFFIKRTFIFSANSGKVNFFQLFLLLEEISIILKLVALLISLKTGTIYFFATGTFEILIAIFFTIYKEDNTKLQIDLRNA